MNLIPIRKILMTGITLPQELLFGFTEILLTSMTIMVPAISAMVTKQL